MSARPSSYEVYDLILGSGIEVDCDGSDLLVKDQDRSRAILKYLLSKDPELKHSFLTDTESKEKWIEFPNHNMRYWDEKEEGGRA